MMCKVKLRLFALLVVCVNIWTLEGRVSHGESVSFIFSDKGFNVLKSEALKGIVDAQLELGFYYLQGKGGEKSKRGSKMV